MYINSLAYFTAQEIFDDLLQARDIKDSIVINTIEKTIDFIVQNLKNAEYNIRIQELKGLLISVKILRLDLQRHKKEIMTEFGKQRDFFKYIEEKL